MRSGASAAQNKNPSFTEVEEGVQITDELVC